mgnify:CR=1 FL=1
MITESIIRALELWIFVLPFTVGGVLLASLAIEFRLFNRLFPVLKPVLQRAHFSPGSGLAFITAFGSPIAAVGMVAELYAEKEITQREAVLVTVATWFPQTIYETFAYIFPIIPLLGTVGVAYVVLFVLNGLVVAVLMFALGSVLLTGKSYEFVEAEEREKIVVKTAFKRSVTSSLRLLRRVVAIGLPVSVAAFILIDFGIFDALPRYLGWMPLPAEALAIIPLKLANPMAAYVTFADLMNAGILDFKSGLLTLLVASAFLSLRYILAHRLPYYFGIFGPALGVKITSVSVGLRLGLTGLMIFLLVLL